MLAGINDSTFGPLGEEENVKFPSLAVVCLLLVAFAGLAGAQTTAPAEPSAPAAQAGSASSDSSQKVAPGTLIPAELVKSLDSKKLKEGDPVNAKVNMDLLQGGKVAVPRDSKLIGHVTEAKARGKDESESTLGIVFDRLILKNGQQLQMHALVQAVGLPMSYSGGGSDTGERVGNAGSPNVNAGPYGGMPNPQMPRGSGGPQDAAAPAAQRVQPLPENATGVVGISGLTLRNTSSVSSVLASDKKSVKLDNGTQLLLRTANP
jgi:hypothetical protein